MYTMLMMMAVSSGGEASAFGGRHGGCQGSSCTGVVVAAPASCQGNSCGGGRGFLGGLCHKSSCNGVVVAAPVSSCTGVVVDSCGCQGSGRGGFLAGLCHKKSSCQGITVGCSGGVVAPTGCTGCTGGVVAPAPAPAVVMPPSPTPAPTPMPK